MAKPLMPKATAVWLIDNTTLTFEQIAEFCELHKLEVQAIADGEVGSTIVGSNPIQAGELTQEEIDRCIADPEARLKMSESNLPKPRKRAKGPRYTPVSKRGDKPDAIAWLLKKYPELSDAQISKIVGTTKPTINAVRDKTHANTPNIKPRDPVMLGLCKQDELNKVIEKARKKAGIDIDAAPADAAEEAQKSQQDALNEPFHSGGHKNESNSGDDEARKMLEKLGNLGTSS